MPILGDPASSVLEVYARGDVGEFAVWELADHKIDNWLPKSENILQYASYKYIYCLSLYKYLSCISLVTQVASALSSAGVEGSLSPPMKMGTVKNQFRLYEFNLSSLVRVVGVGVLN
jgi:hypothetical protein